MHDLTPQLTPRSARLAFSRFGDGDAAALIFQASYKAGQVAAIGFAGEAATLGALPKP